MKRILLMIVRNLIHVPKMAYQLFRCAANVDKYSEQERHNILREMCFRANKGGNVKIKASGIENIPKENGFMFFPNHQGMYDFMALLTICEQPLSVVAKKEVRNYDTFCKVHQVNLPLLPPFPPPPLLSHLCHPETARPTPAPSSSPAYPL